MNNFYIALTITLIILLCCVYTSSKKVYHETVGDLHLKDYIGSLQETIENVHIEGESNNITSTFNLPNEPLNSLDLQFQTNFFNINLNKDGTMEMISSNTRIKPTLVSEENSLQIKVIEEEIDYLNEKIQKFQNILNKINY
jgi:hypothetical protein